MPCERSAASVPFTSPATRSSRISRPSRRAGGRPVAGRLLEDGAADGARGGRLRGDVEAPEARGPGGRPDRRRQHPDRGRLAGTVRAEEAEDLAGRDVEVDGLPRLDAAGVDLAEPPYLDRVHA